MSSMTGIAGNPPKPRRCRAVRRDPSLHSSALVYGRPRPETPASAPVCPRPGSATGSSHRYIRRLQHALSGPPRLVVATRRRAGRTEHRRRPPGPRPGAGVRGPVRRPLAAPGGGRAFVCHPSNPRRRLGPRVCPVAASRSNSGFRFRASFRVGIIVEIFIFRCAKAIALARLRQGPGLSSLLLRPALDRPVNRRRARLLPEMFRGWEDANARRPSGRSG